LSKIRNNHFAGFFERNGADLTAPGNVLGAVLSHEASQGMDRRQPLVAGVNPALPRLFQIGQEEAHQVRRYINYGQSVHGLVQLPGHERNQQRKGIAVTALRVACQIALGDKVFEQKTPHPRPQQRQVIHAAPPVRNLQSAGRPAAAVLVSW
jgi:hypothetical protein